MPHVLSLSFAGDKNKDEKRTFFNNLKMKNKLSVKFMDINKIFSIV